MCAVTNLIPKTPLEVHFIGGRVRHGKEKMISPKVMSVNKDVNPGSGSCDFDLTAEHMTTRSGI